jgi:diacylglycerol kinase family enzyme
MSKAQLPVSVLAQIAGNNQIMDPRALKKSGIIYLQTDALNIKNREHAPMHVDGEPRETARELRIRILPACFKLIQPLPK